MYSQKVLLGQWRDEQCEINVKLDRYLVNRDLGRLHLLKLRRFIGRLMKPIKIAPKSSIKFGDMVQIAARQTKIKNAPPGGIVLSAVLCGTDLEMHSSYIEGTIISCSKVSHPMVRNVFQVCPVNDEVQMEDDLRYGEDFALRYTGLPPEKPMYIGVEIPIYHTPPGNKSKHPILHLDSRKCRSTSWRAYYIHSDERKETIKKPVPGDKDLVIINAATNRALCCEIGCWFETIFGIECEATTYTYYDIYKRETEVNQWCFK